MAGQPQAAAGSSERVLIGNGLPTVPKKLLQKIRNWEYVELAELLPTANPSASSGLPSARFQLLPGLDVVRQRKRQITNITDWTQAFAVYVAALVSHHPSATLELLAYMVTISRRLNSMTASTGGRTTASLGPRPSRDS